ncbi:MAG TPA: signal peptidase II [Vicinamibacterales bacterium]|jgi:signal peptidase II
MTDAAPHAIAQGADESANPPLDSAEPQLVGRRRLEIWLPLGIVALDQLSKALVRAKLPLHESVTFIPGLVDFTHVRNSGAAFGFLNAVDFPFKGVVIALVATAALVGVGIYAASLAHHQLVARLGLALIIGGAAGNLIDRLVAGSVVDFVDVYWHNWHFWAFNVADSAITVGVAIMILDMLGGDQRRAS